jgi:hypothetical protein
MRDVVMMADMTDGPRTDAIVGRALTWGGILIAIVEFSLLVVPAPYQVFRIMERAFYASGMMISFGNWESNSRRRPFWFPIIIGAALQVALMAVEYALNWAIGNL